MARLIERCRSHTKRPQTTRAHGRILAQHNTALHRRALISQQELANESSPTRARQQELADESSPLAPPAPLSISIGCSSFVAGRSLRGVAQTNRVAKKGPLSLGLPVYLQIKPVRFGQTATRRPLQLCSFSSCEELGPNRANKLAARPLASLNEQIDYRAAANNRRAPLGPRCLKRPPVHLLSVSSLQASNWPPTKWHQQEAEARWPAVQRAGGVSSARRL